jgi:uncharacterized coiled-coil DUF342 family protein
MSDTPETDAEAWIETDRANAVVFAKFARKLERERAEAREELSLKCQSVTIASGTISDLLKKSERLEKQIEGLNNFANERFDEIQRVRRERDEAREALRELWQTADAYIPQIDEEQTTKWHNAMALHTTLQ